jgi:hypothetical protein
MGQLRTAQAVRQFTKEKATITPPITPRVRSIFWTPFSIQGSVMSGTQATRETKAKYLRTVMARLVCYLARSPVNT